MLFLFWAKGRKENSCYKSLNPAAYIQVLHRLCDIELVHSGDDDGRGGKEEEQDEEHHIDDEAAEPPDEATNGQMLPEGKTK